MKPPARTGESRDARPLTEDELAMGPEAWKASPNPFPERVFHPEPTA